MSDSKKKGFGFNRTDIKKEEKNNIAIQRNAIKKFLNWMKLKEKVTKQRTSWQRLWVKTIAQ